MPLSEQLRISACRSTKQSLLVKTIFAAILVFSMILSISSNKDKLSYNQPAASQVYGQSINITKPKIGMES